MANNLTNIDHVIGLPMRLPEDQLPTSREVLRYWFFVQSELTTACRGQSPSISSVRKEVMDQVSILWNIVGLPTNSERRIASKIQKLYDDFQSLNRYPVPKRNSAFADRLASFEAQISELFDISACRCERNDNCDVCKKFRPEIRNFLLDQRTTRNSRIPSVLLPVLPDSCTSLSQPISQQSVQTQSSGEVYMPPMPSKQNSKDEKEQKPVDLHAANSIDLRFTNTAKVCDRFGISDRAAAHLINAVMTDLKVLNDSGCNVIDRCKIRRERIRQRNTIIATDKPEKIYGLYFDGKNDKTLCKKDDGSFGNVLRKEEHITLVAEPGSTFLGYTTPENGKAKTIATSMIDFLEDQEIDSTSLCVIGSDSPFVNTGCINGVIRRLEIHFKRPMQWAICLLHMNELPLRHLFSALDESTTTGPRSFSGVLGKQLTVECETLPIVDFKPITNNLPEMDIAKVVKMLTGDQKYLLEIVEAVAKGSVEEKLKTKKPGNLCHSRWLTMANRILRLYVSTKKPTLQLQLLADYVAKVYAPMWFSIRVNPGLHQAAMNFYKLIKLSRPLSKQVTDVIDPVITNNSYFAHAENILVGMICDPQESEKAKRLLKKCNPEPTAIRTFKAPSVINFEAANYTEIIDLENTEITYPPVLKYLDIDTIMKIPAHNQNVERNVKLVSEASKTVTATNRIGYILNTINSRNELPTFKSKKHYMNKKDFVLKED